MTLDLAEVNWFTRSGHTSNEMNLSIAIKNIRSEADLLKNIRGLKWGNFILYAKNRLSYYIKYFHPQEAKGWNDMARQAHSWYAQFELQIATVAAEHGVVPEVLPFIKAIWISYYLEDHYFNNLSQDIPRQFNKIIPIFDYGHIPCGWDGALPKNLGYEAINYTTGKILIW